MAASSSQSWDDSLPPELALRLDQICNRFEDMLRAGESPNLEEFLVQAPESVSGVLRRELECLAQDYELRQRATVAGNMPLASQFEEHDISFLRPAERPGELGWLGTYRVLEVLGSGGMGVVFQAEDTHLQRLIALKVMKPSVAKGRSAKERFLREARATAAVIHDNIVTIHQVGEDRGVPFIAMQLLRGESLHSRLRKSDRLTLREVLRIGREIAAGLAAAHEKGLIHRDIKPANIWLEEHSGRVKILDFGLVHCSAADARLTRSESLLGTPRYMAPEQALGNDVDARSDLFSLGCVLYQLLAGRPPFEGHNAMAVLFAIAEASPTPLAALCPDLNPGLAGLIMRLLSKDRNQRPHSAAEIVRLISQFEAERDATDNDGLPSHNSQVAKFTPSGTARRATGHSRRWIAGPAALVAVALLGICIYWAAGLLPRDRPAALPPANENRESGIQGSGLGFSERAVAQWVLDLGGEVAVETEGSRGLFVRHPAQLPPESFALTWVDLADNLALKDEDLRRFTGLKSLDHLNLSRTRITDRGMAHLTDMPSLICLNLVGTRVGDDGLRHLSGLPSLLQLYVSRCPLTDVSIAKLRALKLDQLTLDGTQVTYTGLRELAAESRLRSLTVSYLGLKESEVQRLSELAPACRIVTEQGTVGPSSSLP